MKALSHGFALLRLLALVFVLAGVATLAMAAKTYSDNGDGTVTDPTTGLVWMRCSMGQDWDGTTCTGTANTTTFDGANSLTGKVTFAGKSDWRVPNISELQTIVDQSVINPAIDSVAFPNTPSSSFWSASGRTESGWKYNNYYAWYVDFSNGYANEKMVMSNSLYSAWSDSSPFQVRLVRAGQSSTPFSLSVSKNGAGTVSSAFAGINCGATCTGNYIPGTQIILTALPATAANFISWSGDCTGSSAACIVTMVAAKSVTATFSGVPTTTTTSLPTTTTTLRPTTTTTTTTLAGTAYTITLSPGWNLLGNGTDQPLTMTTLVGDKASSVTTVWKWDLAQTGWQFYTPSMDATALQAYATNKSYGVLSQVNAGEGFWVNAAKAFSVTLPAGTAISASDFQDGRPRGLKNGWNLVAIGNALSPSVFNMAISATPPTAGVVPLNLTTLWAWDNLQAKWYFYAPNLEAQGGTVLTDYIVNKGYLDFTATQKLLRPGMGFWVNKP